MPYFHFEILKKSKIEAKIQARYGLHIKELAELGFGEVQYLREVTFPFSAVVFSWLLPFLYADKEVFRIEMPLRLVRLFPVMIHRGYACYVCVTGLGTYYCTRFTDGTALYYKNYHGISDEYIERPEIGYYSYGHSHNYEIPVRQALDAHLDNIARMTRKGREPDDNMSLRVFEELDMLNDKMAMKTFFSSAPATDKQKTES